MRTEERGRVCVVGVLDAPGNLGRLSCEIGILRFKVLRGGVGGGSDAIADNQKACRQAWTQNLGTD